MRKSIERRLRVMSNLENTANMMLPIITKGAILIGVILCLLSITIAIYSYLRKKQSLKEIKTYLRYTLGTGALVSVSGLLVNFIARFDIDFASYTHIIPVGYVISLAVYFLFINICDKRNMDEV